MAKISSSTIEHMAVNHINSLILKPGTKLESAIPVNDKGVSFDGSINLYKTSFFRKKDLLGIIPVQIKGKTVKAISPIQAKFSVNMDDLRNYYNEGGVIYFVSEILDDQIVSFAKILLPLNLKPLLDNFGKQSSTTIQLNPVKDNLTLEIICRHFLKEKSRQPVSYIGKYSFTSHDFEHLKLTSISMDSNRQTKNFLNQEMYVYGVNGNIDVPISIVKFEKFTRQGLTNIDINGSNLPYEYKITDNNESISIILENTLVITAKVNHKEVNFKINPPYSLNSYKKILLLLQKINKETSVSLFDGAIHFEDLKWKKEDFIDIDHELASLVNIEDLYTKIGIPFDYHSKGLFIDFTPTLNEIFMEGNYSSIKVKDSSADGMIKLNFGEDFLLAYYSSKEEEKIKSVAAASFKGIEIGLINEEKDEQFKVSPFLLVGVDDLLGAANVSLPLIEGSFIPKEHVYNNITFDVTNKFCLDCLKFFDIKHLKEYALLAKFVSYKMLNSEISDLNRSIMIVNHMQTIYRLGEEFTQSQQHELIEIKEDNVYKDNTMLRLCCNILLKNIPDSKYYFSKLSEEERNEFYDFPIYALAKDILEI